MTAPVTLGTLVRDPALGLGHAWPPLPESRRLTQPVQAVLVSELENPTPWLEGEELLLTIGLLLPDDEPSWRAYLTRLRSARVTALGVGLGPELRHQRMPAALLAAARDLDFTLLGVPRGTPFVAISKAFVRARSAAEAGNLERALNAQRMLTASAAQSPPLERMVNAYCLQTHTSGLIVDLGGAPLALSGPNSAVLKTYAHSRLGTATATRAATLDFEGHRIESQAVGIGGTRGLLLVHHAEPLPQPFRLVTASLASLVSLDMERRHAQAVAALAVTQPIVAGLLAAIIEDASAAPLAASLPAEVGRAWSAPEGAFLVALTQLPPGLSPATLVARYPEVAHCEIAPGLVAAVLPDTAASEYAAQPLPESARMVCGMPTRLGAVSLSLRAARDELQRAATEHLTGGGEGNPAKAGDLGALLTHHEPLTSFSLGLLAPLVAADDADFSLLKTLRAYFEARYSGDGAARSLGVHRHTVRARLRKIEQIVGALDDRERRLALEIALLAHDTQAVAPRLGTGTSLS
ncbi:PucR family transcriptional regulator ligand-binding domain-containing protein [Micrococcales bacterium 31B]|nr:PucR family transcriptional regulator ligand-binding domain-containing protein [Micrococcales bacterium 31B]